MAIPVFFLQVQKVIKQELLQKSPGLKVVSSSGKVLYFLYLKCSRLMDRGQLAAKWPRGYVSVPSCGSKGLILFSWRKIPTDGNFISQCIDIIPCQCKKTRVVCVISVICDSEMHERHDCLSCLQLCSSADTRGSRPCKREKKTSWFFYYLARCTVLPLSCCMPRVHDHHPLGLGRETSVIDFMINARV